jgi:predicted porin
MRSLFLLIPFLGFTYGLVAQQKPVIDSASFYGMVRVHLAAFDKKIQLQENAPRFGVFLKRDINNNLSLQTKFEYGLHVVNGVNFNNDANSTAEFVSNPLNRADVFTTRLAYIAIVHAKWGSLTIGKQWGVYYDIGAYTDNFSLFGGSANGIYAGGTDGGWKGTGRADNAIQYRNRFGRFEMALQTQLFGDYQSFGISGQYSFNNVLTIGTSYNTAKVQDVARKFVKDIGTYSNNFIAGIKYDKNKWYAAGTFSINDDALNTVSSDSAISYPTNGYEILLGYRVNTKWSLEGGINYIDPDSDLARLNDYRLAHYIFGANYFVTPDFRLYLITRISDSKLAFEKNEFDVFAFGLRYNFNLDKKFTKKIP